MKKLYLSIFLIFIFSQLNSQVSGYLGKRMIAEFSFSAYPAFFSPTYNSGDIDLFDLKIGLNTSYDLSLDYIIYRNGMLGIKAGILSTGFTPSDFDSGSTRLTQVRIFKTGIRYSVFNKKKGGAAPLGRSNTFGLDFYSIYDAKVGGVSQIITPNFFVAFTYAWSNRHVLNDRFIIKYGPEFSFISIIPIGTIIAESTGGSTDDFVNENAFEITTRLLTRDFYKLQFSVGYLIF